MLKQRLTVFIDPELIKRAKIHAALEGSTISEVIERALDAYTPVIEENKDKKIRLVVPR